MAAAAGRGRSNQGKNSRAHDPADAQKGKLDGPQNALELFIRRLGIAHQPLERLDAEEIAEGHIMRSTLPTAGSFPPAVPGDPARWPVDVRARKRLWRADGCPVPTRICR